MNEEERRALGSLTFNWTSALEDVWRPTRYHVEGLHPEAAPPPSERAETRASPGRVFLGAVLPSLRKRARDAVGDQSSPNTKIIVAFETFFMSGERESLLRALRNRPDAMAMYCLPSTA